MKDKITTFERIIEMLFFITYRKKTTVPELVNMFSVCESTVYNDIIFLSRYAPIYTKNGLHGGVFLLGDYRNDLFLYLSKDEENLLAKLAGNSDGADKSRLQSIIHKFAMPKKGT